MTNPFFTKAIFSHKVPAIEGGDPNRFADRLKSAGFEAVYLKMADGAGVYKTTGIAYLTWGENVKPELVAALRARGIKVIGWQFNYGDNIAQEAAVAAQQSLRFQVDGWIFDAESKFETNSAAVANAYALCNEYRKRCPSVPIAFCSWARWRSSTGVLWHNEGMAKAFMEKCDVGLPMMYWTTGITPTWMLNESLRQWQTITTKPIIPIGRAYTGDSGTINAGDISTFAAETHIKHLPGLSWWYLDGAIKDSGAWSALASIPGFAPIPEPSPPPAEPPTLTLEQRVANLEAQVAALVELHRDELFPNKIYLPGVFK